MATEAVKIPFVEAAAPATPAASRVVIYAKSDGLMYSKDDAGAETLMSSGASGSVATDAIWDAAGDLAVGSGANTAAKLTMGAAGGAVSRVNGAVAWNSGTSFPTAATGDRYYRTDIFGGTEFKYDGTRWRSMQIFQGVGVQELSLVPGTNATNFRVRIGLWQPTYSVYLLELRGATIVLTTNDGTKFYTVTVKKGSDNTSLGSFTTASDTAGTITNHLISINAVSTENYVYWDAISTSTPGNIFPMLHLTYQLIAT